MRYLYAIHHKPTGRFLPHQPSGQKGGTWVEPTCPTEKPPRFFYRERDAKGFLTTWLKGPQTHTQYQDFDGEYTDDFKIEPARAKEPRIKENWEVVRIEWRML